MLRFGSSVSRVLPVLLFAAGASVHCSSDGQGEAGDGSGGVPSAGGVTASGGAASGGTPRNGGSVGNSGGTTPASGGSVQAGGGPGSGGAAPSSGGSASSGGTPSSGGATQGTGGTPSSGGSQNSGGSSGSGGNGSGGGSDVPGWTLDWSDEFNGPAGSAVDSSKWNLVNKGDGFGNNELEFYTNRTDNASMDGSGNLVIEVMKENYSGRQYTSARLESNGKFERKYGRIEARLQVPKGQGIWPAFWMLGNDISQVSWPNCGEIDIMENIGKEPTIVHGSLHGPGYSGGNPLGGSYTLPGGAKFADAFHVFAVEWEENVIRFYADGNNYETRTPKDVPSGGRWVYDHPFFILLNVAVGGAWPGSPDGSTQFPQQMKVDYVRVYKR